MSEERKGIVVSPGVVVGDVVVMKSATDIPKMKKGAVLVLKRSEPVFAECVMEASAMICETGGRLTHICVVALELGIPCIVQYPEATEVFSDGQLLRLNTFDMTIVAEDT